MSACLAPPPALSKLSHPALLSTGLATPPLTPSPLPLSPITRSQPPPASHKRSHSAIKSSASVFGGGGGGGGGGATAAKMPPPVPSYAMLRSNHAIAIRYAIAKLRWDQVNGQYLPGQDADWNHDQVIAKLEKELRGVEEAQKGLDRFPSICFAPTAEPKAHGPKTQEEEQEAERIEIELQRMAHNKMNEQFPFLKQLFVGPMTKQQARNDKLLREQLKEGDWEDVSVLLPSENLRNFLAQQQKKVAPAAAAGGGGGAPAGPKKTYEQVRYEKEKAKVTAYLQANPTPALLAAAAAASASAANRKASVASDTSGKKRIGPLTKEEWHATLPIYGPPTKGEAMLPLQRAQRAQVIRLLQRPWGEYNERAAGAIEALAELAKERFEEEKKAREDAESVKMKASPTQDTAAKKVEAASPPAAPAVATAKKVEEKK